MGANVGIDCQVALDGTGYWVAAGSYRVHWPRLRKASVTMGGAERYIDAGPGKRVWRFTVLALDALTRYDGQPTGMAGQEYRDALTLSYQRSGALPFVDPHGQSWSVHFDDLVEVVPDLRIGAGLAGSPGAPGSPGATYLLEVQLVEA